MNPGYLVGRLVALLFLWPKKAAPRTIVVSNGPEPGDKDYDPGATQSVSVFEQTFSALDTALGGGKKGGLPQGSGGAPIDCGTKPKVPSNWKKLPTSHPARVARQKWEKCMGNVYKGGKLVK